MSKLIAIIIGVALLVSCSKKPIQVTPLDRIPTLNTKGMVYALPRSVLRIKVEAVKTIVVQVHIVGLHKSILVLPMLL